MRVAIRFAMFTGLAAMTCASAVSAMSLAGSGNAPLSAAEMQARASWRDSMAHIDTPSEGCFKANYPSILWQRVACRAVTPRVAPIPPRFHTALARYNLGAAQTTGNGNDYAIETATLISQTVGTFSGGALTDRLAKYSPRWYALAPAIGVAAAYPFIMAVFNAPSWQNAALWLLIPGALSYIYLGPTYGVVQNIVPTHRRATTAAIMLFFLNLIALGFGPPLTGVAIDRFAAFHLAHPNMPGMWAAVSHLFDATAAPFKQSCPGGLAPKGAPAAAGQSCKAALVLATRHGILLAYAAGLWGAFHYLLASFGVAKVMSAARARRGEAD